MMWKREKLVSSATSSPALRQRSCSAERVSTTLPQVSSYHCASTAKRVGIVRSASSLSGYRPALRHPVGPPACTAGGLSEGEADDLRVVVAGLLGELGVDVHDIVGERPGEQRVAEQDVVEGLRVALEVVGVALVLREGLDERVQHAGPQGGDGVGELEVVEVAEHHHAGVGVSGVDRGHEVVHDPGLLDALRLGDALRRLEAAEQWLVAALGVEVVGDHEQVVAPESELPGQRLAAGGY